MNQTISIQSLDAAKASDVPFEFQYINQKGEETGVFFIVLGGESEKVKAEIARLQNERRRKAAVKEVAARTGVGRQKAAFDLFEDDVEYGVKTAAVRLVGWRGISEPYSPELALSLCAKNQHIAATIVTQSDAMENFI